MNTKFFPVIDLAATGNNIRRLRIERGLTVRDIQSYFGFEEPRAVYKWQNGESLPTVITSTRSGISSACPWIRYWFPSKISKVTASSRKMPAARVISMPGCSGCVRSPMRHDQFCGASGKYFPNACE